MVGDEVHRVVALCIIVGDSRDFNAYGETVGVATTHAVESVFQWPVICAREVGSDGHFARVSFGEHP